MPRIEALLSIISDGRFHSGEALGARLQVTRSAIWKALKVVQGLGLEVQAVQGKGYRLAGPIELLDSVRIRRELDSKAAQLLGPTELHLAIDSTNATLMRRLPDNPQQGTVCLAESQTEGRGRRGRSWVSSFGQNVSLSVVWRFQDGASSLAGLSLAIGVTVLRALKDIGIPDIELKWPNDLLWSGRKLAGILVEVSGESTGPCHVVVGLGLNIKMDSRQGSGIDQPWVDLNTIHPGLSRNRVVGALLSHLLNGLDEFSREGLASFLSEWQSADAFSGKSVLVASPSRTWSGEARGIDAEGALLVEVDGEIRRFVSGEVSLRARG